MNKEPVKLKPCPFCGSEAVLITKHKAIAYFVECENEYCYCSVRDDTEEEVIAMWNKRPGETKLNEELGHQDATIEFLNQKLDMREELIDNLIEVGDVFAEMADPDCEIEASAIWHEITFEWKEER